MTATPAESAQPHGNRESMNAMGNHSAEGHVTDKPRRDHLWVLVVIAACCLIEVWASWVTIGSMSSFPRLLGRIPTDWTLAVTSEAYWGYALYAWLAASPGPRSRQFAMWSAGAVFALSLVGQGASHVLPAGTRPPAFLVVFVTDLPVLVLALIAILIHLRQKDRAEATEAAERAAREARQLAAEIDAADDRTELRADLEAISERLRDAEIARDEARRQADEALKRADTLAAKLAAKSAQRTRSRKRQNAQAEDLSTEARALKLLEDEPALGQPRMGGELARKLGVSPATGRRLHGLLTAQQDDGEPLTERSPDGPDARSDERSEETR